MNISAVVMASGFSSRMGENKLKLKFKGREIYKYTIDLVNSFDFKDKIVVSNDNEICKYAEELGFKTFNNENAEVGKSESIKIALREVQDDVRGYMFFVCDQPLVSRETVSELINSFNENYDKITFPIYGSKRGAPMLFPSAFKGELLNLKGDKGGVVLIEEDNSKSVSINREAEHIDIDTVADYERLLEYER